MSLDQLPKPNVVLSGGGLGVSLGGNTSGTPALVSTGTVYLLGGSNITLSQNGQSIEVNAGGGTAAGAVQFSAGTLSATRTDLTFGDSNGISFGLDTDGILTGTVRTNYAGSNGAITGGSITVNTSGVSINLPAYLTTADLSANSSKYLQAWELTGNTAGTTSSLQGTKIYFEGGNSITVSGHSNTVKFSVGNYLTTAMASNRGSDFVNATAAFAGTNASGTIASDGISVSVNAQSVQTQNCVDLSIGGNTDGTPALISSGTAFLMGGNNITLSQDGQSITISGPNVAGAQTGISGIVASDATYTSGTVTFTGVGGGVTVKSNTGQRIDISVGPYITTGALSGDTSKYVQAWELTGNTAGTTSSLQGTKIYFEGGNSITVSGNSNTIKFSIGNYLTTAALSQDSSKYAGTNGAITGGSITVNTSGVSVNLPAYLTTAALSGDTSKYVQNWKLTGNTAGTTSSAQGTDLWFEGGNSITVSGNSNTIKFSVGAYLTTAALSQDSSKYAGTNGAITGGSITVNTSGVSVNLPAYLTTAALSGDTSKYMQAWELTGNTAGTTSSAQGTKIYFEGGNSITVSGNSNTVKFSVGNYLTTAALSADSSKYAGTNGAITNGSITVNTSGVSVNIPAQTNQTIGIYASSLTTLTSSGTLDARSLSVRGIGIASVGYSAGELLISVPSGGGGLTNINLSAGTTSNLLSKVTFADSNGVSWGLNASTITASVTTYATVGTATSGYPVASANSIGTVTRWAAEDHRHAGVGAVGISTSGNTAGTTGSEQGTYWFQGGNNLTVSQITSNNGSHTLVLSGAATGLKLSAGTSSIVATDYTFSNSNGISFGLNGSTVTAAGPFCGWLEPYSMTNTAFFAPGAGTWYLAPFTAPGSMSGGRFNFFFSNTSTAGIAIDIAATAYASNTTGTKQQSYTYSLAAALYSQGAGANSTRLDSLWSNSFSFGLSHKVVCSVTGGNNSVSVANSWSISYISEIGSAGEYTLNQYAVNQSTNYSATSMDRTVLASIQSSIRNMLSDFVIQPVGFNSTVPAGAYWIGFAWSSTSNSAATNFGGTGGASTLLFSQKSMLGISRLLLEASYRNWASTNTTARSHLMPYGLYTAAANMVPPTNIALSSDLSSLASAWVPYFNYQFQGITK